MHSFLSEQKSIKVFAVLGLKQRPTRHKCQAQCHCPELQEAELWHEVCPNRFVEASKINWTCAMERNLQITCRRVFQEVNALEECQSSKWNAHIQSHDATVAGDQAKASLMEKGGSRCCNHLATTVCTFGHDMLVHWHLH